MPSGRGSSVVWNSAVERRGTASDVGNGFPKKALDFGINNNIAWRRIRNSTFLAWSICDTLQRRQTLINAP
jgi:hypothetical protein